MAGEELEIVENTFLDNDFQQRYKRHYNSMYKSTETQVNEMFLGFKQEQ